MFERAPWLPTLVAISLVATMTSAQAPVFDSATETTHRLITWDDFQGKLSRSKAEQAQISTAIRAKPFEVRATPTNKGFWNAVSTEVVFYATMDKTLSGAGKGARNDLLLSHEQGHFDLAEIVARRITRRLRGLESHGATEEEARGNLLKSLGQAHEQGLEELAELQADYDRDTRHGVARRRQKEWNEKITNWLAEVGIDRS